MHTYFTKLTGIAHKSNAGVFPVGWAPDTHDVEVLNCRYVREKQASGWGPRPYTGKDGTTPSKQWAAMRSVFTALATLRKVPHTEAVCAALGEVLDYEIRIGSCIALANAVNALAAQLAPAPKATKATKATK